MFQAPASVRTLELCRILDSLELKLTKDGNLFDGIIQNAFFGFAGTVEGHIFRSDRYPQGYKITTSLVVKVGEIGGIGQYVETKGQSRYLIGALATEDHKDWFRVLKDRITQKDECYRKMQWS